MTNSPFLPPPAGAPASEPAFIAFAESLDVNWSDDLEAMHEESSRDHFLDVWTRRAICEAIAPAIPSAGTVLDAGCSSGYLLEDLRRDRPGATLLGLDLVAGGLRRAYALVPDAHLALADVCAVPLADGVCDAVVSANLLEHVPDDVGALTELRRVTRPGGRIAVIVPAGPGTYDYYDRFLGHERRYARHELAEKMRSVGLEVVRDAYVGSIIYPAFWLVKKLNRRRHPEPSESKRHELVARDIARTTNSRIGALTADLERNLLRHNLHLPFGIRSLVVAERPT